MTEQEILDARRRRFRVDGDGIRTLEDAQRFISDVGFSLVYPLRHRLHAPVASFMAAYIGSDVGVPYQHVAFADPRATAATDLMVRLLRSKSAFEVAFHDDSALLVSAEVFPYYYALVGEKSPKSAPKVTGSHRVSRLAVEIYDAICRHGALTKSELRNQHLERGSSLSDAGLERALQELWSVLKITRTDYSPSDGSRWDLLSRWASEPVQRGARMSSPQATSAMISSYLQGVIAAEESQVADFMAQFATRSRALETMRALVAAREISVATTGEGKTFLKITERAPARSVELAVLKTRKRRNG